MLKILYLEDDINLNQTVTEFLEDNNFKVISSYNGEDALTKLYEQNFDLLLFDVNLPDINGFELLQTLRDASILTPAIFITTLNDIDSIDKAYGVGADDYVKKPFILKELLHRINTLLKKELQSLSLVKLQNNTIFDIKSGVLLKDNIKQKITPKEIQLLKILIKYKNNIAPLNEIYSTLWSSSENISDGSLRSYIKKLRLILGSDNIISIKKQGYKLVV